MPRGDRGDVRALLPGRARGAGAAAVATSRASAWIASVTRGAASPTRGALAVVWIIAVWSIAFGVLLASAAFRLKRARDAGRFCLGACGLSAITHAVFLGTDRYHLTLVPVLAPVAAMGLVAWRDARGARVV